jgi:SAM-dependent methyltransferase
MLYHVPDRERAFREIARVLKPGGRVYAVTLGRDHLREIYELAEQVDAGYTDRAAADWEIPFRLDNGPAEFSRHFSDVSVRLYDDGLAITDADPLVDYVRSLGSTDHWSAHQVDRLRTEIGERLQRQSVIEVRKEVGMILGHRAGD